MRPLPVRDQDLPPADLWDKKVAEGLSPDSATAYVARIHGPPPQAPLLPRIAELPEPSALSPRSKSGSAIAGLANGATLGFADEALGAINGLDRKLHGGSYLEGYREGRDKVRSADTESRDAHGGIHLASELAGGLASGIGGGLAAEGSAVIQGAKAGAKVGALAGVGNADGGVAERIKGGALGAAGGAVIGAAAPKVIGAATKAAGNVLTASGLRPTGRTAAEIIADEALLREPIGPQATMQSVNARSPLPPRIATRVRAAFGAGVENAGIESSKTRALREIGRRFDLDNVSPADATRYATENARKPLAPLDLGGGNVAGLARLSKDVPGLGRTLIPKFLHERSAGTFGDEGATLNRITQDVENRIGLKPENYHQTLDDMMAEQKALTKPAYDKVRNLEIEDPEVLSLFDIPEFRGVHKAVATAERIRPNSAVIKPLSEIQEVGGSQVRVQNPQTLGTLDKMRQYVGDIARGKLESKAIDRNTARAMLERLDAATQRLDELHPDYAEARAGYSGRARAMDAYQVGKDEFMSSDPREIAASLAKMPPGEADLYRRGGYDALRANKLTKMEDGANIGAFLEKNPDIRQRIAALAKAPEDAAALRSDLHAERAMGQRKNDILGGPNSAERMIEHASTVPRVTQIGNMARTIPGVGKFAGGLVDNTLTRRTSEQTGDVMGEVAKYLTRTGPEGIQTLLDEISALKSADAATAVGRGVRGGRIGGVESGRSRRPLPKRS